MISKYTGPIFNERHEVVDEHPTDDWYQMQCDCCGSGLETDEVSGVVCSSKDELRDIAYDEEWICMGDVCICMDCQRSISRGEIKIDFKKEVSS